MTGDGPPPRAVLFDLLTGLLDSWSLWDAVAGDAATGRRWRLEYLRVTYATGAYRPYPELVAEACVAQGLDPALADRLVGRWDELGPWPEAASVVAGMRARVPVGVVTNCSRALGERAVARVGTAFDVVVTAEEAGFYKPRPEPYLAAAGRLGLPPEQVLFVAGSPYDLRGATAVGMPVWWHNRARLDRGDAPAPVGEAGSLEPLTDLFG